MKEYNLRERAEIIKLAQEASKSLKAESLIEYFEQSQETASDVNALVMFLFLTARKLWSASLIAASINDELYNSMNDFSEDDLVCELSSFRQRVSKENVMDYVGYIKQWDEKNAEYLIERLDGERVSWENAKFIKIPIET